MAREVGEYIADHPGAANPVWTGLVVYEGGQPSPSVTYTESIPGKANPDVNIATYVPNQASRDLALAYLPLPRVRIYRPLNAGRSTRGRRVRSSSSSRGSPRRASAEDGEPHHRDVARPGGRFGVVSKASA